MRNYLDLIINLIYFADCLPILGPSATRGRDLLIEVEASKKMRQGELFREACKKDNG